MSRRGRSLKIFGGGSGPVSIGANGGTLTLESRTIFGSSGIALWDTETGCQLGEVGAPGQAIPDISPAISNDRRTLAFIQYSSFGEVLALQAMEPVQSGMCAGLAELPTYAKTAFSSDGKTIGVGTRDGTIFLTKIGPDLQGPYSVPSVPPRRIGDPFSAHSGAVAALAFSHGDDRIASGGADGVVHVWDVATQKLISSLQTKHAARVSRLVFSRDDKAIGSAGDDGTIMVWDAATGQPLGGPINDFTAAADRFALSPDGAILALPDRNRVVLWDVRAGGVSGQPLVDHDAIIQKVVFNPDGAMLAAGHADGMVTLWGLVRKDAGVPDKPIPAVSGSVLDLEFSPDGKILAVAGNAKGGIFDNLVDVSVWDIATRLNKARYSHLLPGGEVPLVSNSKELAFGPDGKKLWLIDGGRELYFLDLVPRVSSDFIFPAYVFPGWQTVLGLNPNTGLLASGSYGGTIALWATQASQAKSVPWVAHSSMVTSLAFDLPGKVLASADSSGEIRLWNTENLSQIGPVIPAHRVQGTSLAFSPDGARLASGSAGGEIKLWDAKSGILVRPGDCGNNRDHRHGVRPSRPAPGVSRRRRQRRVVGC